MEKATVHLLSCVRKGITYSKAQGIKHLVKYCSAFPGRSTKATSSGNELKGETKK
jgi:hypothetical protein